MLVQNLYRNLCYIVTLHIFSFVQESPVSPLWRGTSCWNQCRWSCLCPPGRCCNGQRQRDSVQAL